MDKFTIVVHKVSLVADVNRVGAKTKEPDGARPSLTSSFRLSLFFSSVIMAALKHYQPCLQI